MFRIGFTVLLILTGEVGFADEALPTSPQVAVVEKNLAEPLQQCGSDDEALDCYSDLGQSQVLYHNDLLTFDLILDLQRKFYENYGRKPTALFLTTPGGAIEDYENIIKIFLKLAEDHYNKYQLPLVLVFKDQCDSFCTLFATRMTHEFYQQLQKGPVAKFKILVAAKTTFAIEGLKRCTTVSDEKAVGKTTCVALRGIALQEAYAEYLKRYFDAGLSREFYTKNKKTFDLSIKKFQVFGADFLCQSESSMIPKDSCMATDDSLFYMIRQIHTPYCPTSPAQGN